MIQKKTELNTVFKSCMCFSNLFSSLASNRGDPLPLTGYKKDWGKTLEGKPEDSKEQPFGHVLLMNACAYNAKFRRSSVPQPSSLLVLVVTVSSTWEMILNGKHLNRQPPHNSWKHWVSKSESYGLSVLNWNQAVPDSDTQNGKEIRQLLTSSESLRKMLNKVWLRVNMRPQLNWLHM